MKTRLVSGYLPLSATFTQVRQTPRGTPYSALQATTQDMHPMHFLRSITMAYLFVPATPLVPGVWRPYERRALCGLCGSGDLCMIFTFIHFTPCQTPSPGYNEKSNRCRMAAYHHDKSLSGNSVITTKPISHDDKGGKTTKRKHKDRPISKIIESFKTGSKET